MRFVASKMRASKVRNRYFVEIPSRAKFSEQLVLITICLTKGQPLWVGLTKRKGGSLCMTVNPHLSVNIPLWYANRVFNKKFHKRRKAG